VIAQGALLTSRMSLMAERTKFQFRTRDLLWAVNLIAFEIWVTVGLARRGEWGGVMILFCASLGTVIGCLYRQPIRGTFIGLGLCGLFASGVGLAILLIDGIVVSFSR
jgi:hypothetical protein